MNPCGGISRDLTLDFIFLGKVFISAIVCVTGVSVPCMENARLADLDVDLVDLAIRFAIFLTGPQSVSLVDVIGVAPASLVGFE